MDVRFGTRGVAASFAAHAYVVCQKADRGSRVHLKLEGRMRGGFSLSLLEQRICIIRSKETHGLPGKGAMSKSSICSLASGLDRFLIVLFRKPVNRLVCGVG